MIFLLFLSLEGFTKPPRLLSVNPKRRSGCQAKTEPYPPLKEKPTHAEFLLARML